MKLVYILLIFGLLVSCSSDNSKSSANALEAKVEAPSQDKPSEKSVVQTDNTEKKIENVTAVVEEEITSKSLDEKQKEIKKEQIEKSVNKEKNCSDLIVDYEKLIDAIAKDKTNTANLNKLRDWANDIFHNTCLKDNVEYQQKYTEINKKLG